MEVFKVTQVKCNLTYEEENNLNQSRLLGNKKDHIKADVIQIRVKFGKLNQ